MDQKQQAATPAKAPEKVRHPKVGDSVRFRPWGGPVGDETCHAVVARVFGDKVNLSYLSGTGQWIGEGGVPFDDSGTMPGHWSWPKG